MLVTDNCQTWLSVLGGVNQCILYINKKKHAQTAQVHSRVCSCGKVCSDNMAANLSVMWNIILDFKINFLSESMI